MDDLSKKDEKLNELVKKLLALGEDQKELEFWKAIFLDLEPEEQDRVLKNLEEELKGLQQLKDE